VSQQAKMFVENEMYAQGAEHLSVSVFPLDERINVQACPTGYQFEISNQKAIKTYSTIKASCEQSDWYLFLNVKVEQLKQVVITNETLSPGTLLTQQNLTIADINTQKLRHTTFTNVEELIGARLKYRVRPGQPVTPNMVCFVCKGDVITLAARAQGLSISTKGIAQQDGNKGDTIKVKNSRSDKVVLAKVMDHNTAMVSI
jgi:flagella basal body P-ring formation protein FlgA